MTYEKNGERGRTAKMQKTATRDTRLSSAEPLITPAELIEQLPIPSEVEQTVLEGREQVERIIDGKDNRLMAVVGPCSIHDEEAALEYAGRVKDLTKKLSDRLLIVMRVYFEKPRTTVRWKGFIYDPNLNHTFDIASGLRRARALLLKIGELGVYAGTEFLDPIVPQYIAGLVSWVAIGARTTESQTHRQMASGLSMPVGFKNSTDGSTQVAADAITSARSPHAFLGIDRHGRSVLSTRPATHTVTWSFEAASGARTMAERPSPRHTDNLRRPVSDLGFWWTAATGTRTTTTKGKRPHSGTSSRSVRPATPVSSDAC